MFEITWLGHATFQFRLDSGEVIVMDPWVEGNPMYPKGHQFDRIDAMLISHGHFDHIHDAIPLAKKFKPKVVAIYETCAWLTGKGVENCSGMNKGGTQEAGPLKVTMTHAVHSCGISDGEEIVYGGEACGYVITLENGTRIYHAGDTMVFGDMKIIGELFKPDIALLPIGGFYTMDPVQGAHAIRLLGTKVVVPMHYGTFPVLTGTPEQLRDLTKDISGLQLIDLRPGETLTGELKRLVPA